MVSLDGIATRRLTLNVAVYRTVQYRERVRSQVPRPNLSEPFSVRRYFQRLLFINHMHATCHTDRTHNFGLNRRSPSPIVNVPNGAVNSEVFISGIGFVTRQSRIKADGNSLDGRRRTDEGHVPNIYR